MSPDFFISRKCYKAIAGLLKKQTEQVEALQPQSLRASVLKRFKTVGAIDQYLEQLQHITYTHL